jgi:glutathione S-transferase
MQLTLYAVPGSHPCEAVAVALELKGLPYDRVDLLPGVSQVQQLARFGRRTVPGLVADGYKISGSSLILRALDGFEPDPPLFPRDPEARAAVEAAEHWGDGEMQDAARWISVYALTQRPEAGKSFLAKATLPDFPDPITSPLTRATMQGELRLIGPGVSGAEQSLRELPGLLDRVDELIEAGTIGAEAPNAADLQIGASIALLAKLEDLRPAIEARPCGRLAQRLFSFPGSIPAGALPAEWLRAMPLTHADVSLTSGV